MKKYNQDEAWKELIKCYRQEDRDFYWLGVYFIGGLMFIVLCGLL